MPGIKRTLSPSQFNTRRPLTGQVPSKSQLEGLQLVKEASKPPTRFKIEDMTNQTGSYLSLSSVLNSLGMDKSAEGEWSTFLGETLDHRNTMGVRQAIVAKMYADGMDPSLRRALLQRSMRYRRDMLEKSFRKIVTVDELKKAQERPDKRFVLGGVDRLKKAEARGGSYVRRTTSAKGKHRYFYDDESYVKSKGAHLNGGDVAKSAIKKSVSDGITAGGSKGMAIKDLGGLVKRYGSAMVKDALKAECGGEGSFKFKKGCFTARSKKK